MPPRHRAEALLPRLPRLLAYPLQSPMPWMIGGLCFLRLFSHLPSLLGLAFELIFWVMAFKLAVEALTNTAQGRHKAVTGEDFVASDSDAISQIVLQVGAGLVLFMLERFVGEGAALVGLAVALLVMPAVTAMLAIDGGLLGALNPMAWGALIGRLGAAYFAVVAVLVVLQVGVALLEWGFGRVMPGTMALLPTSVVTVYALVVGFHVIGDLLHRHHEVLGMDVAPAVPRPGHATPEEDVAMADAERLSREGRHADAAERLRQLFGGRGASDPVHDRYRQCLQAAGELEALARHTDDYLPRLLATGKDRRALAVAVEMRALSPTFLPMRGDDTARLVLQAARSGQAREAVALAEGFEQRFPDEPALPQVVLEASRLMAERLGRETDAAARLRRVLGRHGEHALAPELRAALEQAERLEAIARGPA